MSNKIILLVLFFIVGLSNSYSKIWTVDNNPGNSGANFTNLQSAHSTASNEDTIYINGTGLSYGKLTLTKRLIVVGPGYFLGENPFLQANISSAKIDSVIFNTGSGGSLICGLEISFVITNTSNITIMRNWIKSLLSISSNTHNITIIQNYIGIESSYPYKTIEYSDQISNLLISNNYIYGACGGKHAALTSAITLSNNIMNTLSSSFIVLEYIRDSNIWNNIIVQGYIYGFSNNSILNNIGNSTQFGTSNGNQSNVDMSTVFINTGSRDGKYRLKTGSPAIGAGVNGEDVGMFGGINPYVLSGVPPIPSIYFFSAPFGSSVQGLPVRVKIKSNK